MNRIFFLGMLLFVFILPQVWASAPLPDICKGPVNTVITNTQNFLFAKSAKDAQARAEQRCYNIQQEAIAKSNAIHRKKMQDWAQKVQTEYQ